MDGGLCFTGAFKTMPKTYESWVGYLFSDNGDNSCGRFVSCTASAKFIYQPKRPDQMELEIGRSYYYLDGYWGERAAMVLDRTCCWVRTEFKPRDAFEPDWSPRGGAHFWGPASQHQSEPGQIIPQGWNHEHCGICWAKISQHAQKHGYRSHGKAGEVWVCESCYARYVLPRNLDFITNA